MGGTGMARFMPEGFPEIRGVPHRVKFTETPNAEGDSQYAERMWYGQMVLPPDNLELKVPNDTVDPKQNRNTTTTTFGELRNLIIKGDSETATSIACLPGEVMTV